VTNPDILTNNSNDDDDDDDDNNNNMLDDPGLFPCRSRSFFSHRVQTGSGALRAFFPIDTEGNY
jgi:hypothetical protein